MKDQDPNDIDAASRQSPNDRRDSASNPEVNQPAGRPYGDAGNLYEIPRVRPDDPPMRHWWTDDEPQQESGGSRGNS